MAELLIPRVEQRDIQAPILTAEGTTIVLQRHEAYQRDKAAQNAGSITEFGAYDTDLAFFDALLAQENTDGPHAMMLFVSSDTQYASGGYRSMETTDLAQLAAIAALQERGIDPAERIINIHPAFTTHTFAPMGTAVRPLPGLREPHLFGAAAEEYLRHLLQKYGDSETGDLTTAAWKAHEADAERTVREQTGAEGVHDIIGRTKASVALLQRYAHLFHTHNKGAHLVIWAGTHYDTISPLVKDATNTPLETFLPVDYGGGVVIELSPTNQEMTLNANRQTVALHLGARAVTSNPG
ncbi:MAG TPA: hypothetical protein VJM32_04695 [Candidatus Saccharimonadales bacterium]|nr:hypothetical protein [Candidatus Saccharimonadales bacterium]